MTGVQLPKHGYAYSILGQGPPILMYQIGSDETRILIDIPHDTQYQLRNSEAVRSYIRQRIMPIVPEFVRPSLGGPLGLAAFETCPTRGCLRRGMWRRAWSCWAMPPTCGTQSPVLA